MRLSYNGINALPVPGIKRAVTINSRRRGNKQPEINPM
jgi:hypothetical protein